MQADPVKYELWGLGIGLALALTCAILIVIANGSSRNLALGLGALVGAVVVFGVQALFELQGSTATDDIYIEVVVDYQTKSVRSVQPTLYSHNIFVEDEVSKLLADKSPPLGRDDAPRIVRDLAVVSVLSYLFEEQPDWQLNSSVYKTARGTMSTWQGNDCKRHNADEQARYGSSIARTYRLREGLRKQRSYSNRLRHPKTHRASRYADVHLVMKPLSQATSVDRVSSYSCPWPYQASDARTDRSPRQLNNGSHNQFGDDQKSLLPD